MTLNNNIPRQTIREERKVVRTSLIPKRTNEETKGTIRSVTSRSCEDNCLEQRADTAERGYAMVFISLGLL